MDVVIIGATGLCGNNFLKQAIESTNVRKITTFSRYPVPGISRDIPKLDMLVSPKIVDWKRQFPKDADVCFSGIATNRTDAGSLEKQRLIDHDLQVELASFAKDNGCKTFVLISSMGANAGSMFGYLKLKGETEISISELGFERTIILRPGTLLGNRVKPLPGTVNKIFGSVSSWLYRSPMHSAVGYPVQAEELAAYALKLIETLPKGVHYIDGKDILDNK